jgi:hypothetical protein
LFITYSEYNQSLAHLRGFFPEKEIPWLAETRSYGKLGVRGTATAVNTQPSLNAYIRVIGESEGEIPFERSKSRRDDNIKICRVFIVQPYQTSQYVVPRCGIFLGKRRSTGLPCS